MTPEEFKKRVSSPRAAPYNTGKVQIGIAYVPRPRIEFSRDAYDVQTALLRKGRPSLVSRIFQRLI